MKAVCALVLVLVGVEAGLQSIRIKGTLRCPTRPSDRPGRKEKDSKGNCAWLQLYDEDTYDMMDEQSLKFDENGEIHFEMEGSAEDTWMAGSDIEPLFKVYHDCDDESTPGQRRYKVEIDDKWVTKGKNPDKTFDMGVINLALKHDGEERDFNAFRTFGKCN